MKRVNTLYLDDDAAGFVSALADKLRQSPPVFRWVTVTRRREVWAKVITASTRPDEPPGWRHSVTYDLGTGCRGWPRPDGSPSVRDIVEREATP